MVQTLETIQKEKKERLAIEKKKEQREQVNKTVKSSRKRPDVGGRNEYTEFIENAKADALSEDTMIDLEKDDVQDRRNKRQVKFANDDDRSSVSSFEPRQR
jgi:hypothetical protein